MFNNAMHIFSNMLLCFPNHLTSIFTLLFLMHWKQTMRNNPIEGS